MMRFRSELLRALLILPLSFGCLSDPEGLAPDGGIEDDAGVSKDWPPEVETLDVLGAGSGDVDGDGLADVIAVLGGTETGGAGVLLLRGGVDVMPDEAQVLRSFSTRVSLGDIGGPVLVRVHEIDSSRPGAEVLVVHSRGTQVRLALLAGTTLETIREVDLPHPVPAAPVPTVLEPITFGPGGEFLFIGIGPQLAHVQLQSLVTGNNIRVQSEPPPAGQTMGWNAQQVLWVGTPQDGAAYVASRDGIWKGRPLGGPVTWEPVRTGAPWLGNTRAMIPPGTSVDIVGIEVATPSRLCLWEPLDGGAGNCAEVSIPVAPSSLLTIFPGEFATPAGAELVVFQRATPSTLRMIPGVRRDGAGVPTFAPLSPLVDLGAKSIPLLGNFKEAGQPREFLFLAADGSAVCLRYGTGQFVGCDQ